MPFHKLAFLLFILVAPSLGQTIQTLVMQKDSTSTEGILLSISPERVIIDPAGFVSKRIITKEQIKSVTLIKLNRVIHYPITDISVLADLGYKEAAQTKIQHKRDRMWMFSLGAGIGTSFYGMQQGGLEVDFSTKRIFEMGFRYHMPRSFAAKGGKFLDISYYNSRQQPSFSTDASYYYDDPVYARSLQARGDVTVHSFAFDYGYTTGYGQKMSYSYFSGGLSLLLLSNHESTGLKSNYFGLRLGAGTILGISSRLALHLRLLMDLAVWGMGQNKGISVYNGNIYETTEPGLHPETDGGGINILLALAYYL